MKKSLATLICAILVSSVSPQAQAATKPVDVINGFQKALSNHESVVEAFIAKFESDRSVLVKTFEAAQKTAESTRGAEILNAKNSYETQAKKEPEWEMMNSLDQQFQSSKDAALRKRDLELARLKQDFLKQKPITTASKNAFATAVKQAQETYNKEFLSALQLYNSQKLNQQKSAKFNALNQQWEQAKIDANTKYANTVSNAKEAAWLPLDAIDAQFDAGRDELDKQTPDLEAAIRAAQHASKTSLDFDRAFVTALKFEWNLNGLYLDLSSWDMNLRAKADKIWWSYNDSEAQKINQTLGSFYTSDPKFQAQSKLVAVEYEKLTQVTLIF
jgi:hypothetical protein